LYDKQVVRRRRAVLALLVGFSIVMLTGYFGESTGGPLHRFQSGVQTILSPIEAGASRAFQPIRDLAGWFGDVFDAKGENEELRNDLAEARAQLAEAETAVNENEQLRGLVELPEKEGFPAAERVTARVIWKSPTAWYSTIQINQGADQGIAIDQPVITGDGLVGKVTQVSGGVAVVTLITDAESSVSAQIQPDGAHGIIQPSVGDPSDMRLRFIQKGHEVEEGATVVTSGFTSGKLDSIFPRGIPIGRVTEVSSDELELYREVRIKPFADFRQMDYVQVLTTEQKQPVAGAGDP
jgi:rod shape-determining protein MreC